jgi:hypothetical protein
MARGHVESRLTSSACMHKVSSHLDLWICKVYVLAGI